MDVVLDPRARDPSLVEADVEAVRGVGLLEHGIARCESAIISAVASASIEAIESRWS